jgi:hypothetical protein
VSQRRQRRGSARTLARTRPAYLPLAILGLAEELPAALVGLPVAAYVIARRPLSRCERSRAGLARLRTRVAELEDAAGRLVRAIAAGYQPVGRECRKRGAR